MPKIGTACPECGAFIEDESPQRTMERPPLGITARCSVINVVDGDTLDVELRIPVRIRLLDCWAPDVRTTDADEKVKGLAAKKALVDVTKHYNNNGQVFIPTSDALSVKDVLTLDRLLGRVWIDGFDTDLSRLQVLSGNASTKKGGALGT